mmetsp:Transcript_62628/g.71853  ORF Transcript_62628/g.71853 Transcript_62628/m.71853 type:complete len:131 (+) Transcript_62628:105-497(+)
MEESKSNREYDAVAPRDDGFTNIAANPRNDTVQDEEGGSAYKYREETTKPKKQGLATRFTNWTTKMTEDLVTSVGSEFSCKKEIAEAPIFLTDFLSLTNQLAEWLIVPRVHIKSEALLGSGSSASRRLVL